MSAASLQHHMTHLEPLFGRESRQKVFQRENLLLGSESSEIYAAAVGRHLWTLDTAVKRDARSLARPPSTERARFRLPWRIKCAVDRPTIPIC